MPAPIKADDLFNAWSRKDWKSIYVFAGQEDFLIEQAVHQAVAHWLTTDETGLNRDRFDGDQHSADEIVASLQTMPFLGGTRLVQIDNACKLKADEQRQIAAELSKLNPDTKVIFVWGKAWERDDSKKALVEAVGEIGSVVIFWPLFPEAAQRWLVQRAKVYKKTLSHEGAAWLIEQGGESLRLLDSELQKAALFVGERPDLDLEDLHESFGYRKASSPFEWVAEVRGRRTAHAVSIVDHLLKEGEAAPMLLALLTGQIRSWLSAKTSKSGSGMMGMRYGVRRGDENRFIQDLGRWKDDELMTALTECLRTDQAIKTGKETPDMAMTLLTLRLCSQARLS